MTDQEWDDLWVKSPTEAEVQATLRERERAATLIEQERRASAWRAIDPKGRTCDVRTALTLMEWETQYGRFAP